MSKKINVIIHYGAQTDAYWADSEDLDGLVVEAKTKSQVYAEAKAAVTDLFELQFNGNVPFVPKITFQDE